MLPCAITLCLEPALSEEVVDGWRHPSLCKGHDAEEQFLLARVTQGVPHSRKALERWRKIPRRRPTRVEGAPEWRPVPRKPRPPILVESKHFGACAVEGCRADQVRSYACSRYAVFNFCPNHLVVYKDLAENAARPNCGPYHKEKFREMWEYLKDPREVPKLIADLLPADPEPAPDLPRLAPPSPAVATSAVVRGRNPFDRLREAGVWPAVASTDEDYPRPRRR